VAAIAFVAAAIALVIAVAAWRRPAPGAVPLARLLRAVTGRLLSLPDITDRRRAAVALRSSEARFRALFEQSPEACYLCDLEGRLIEANGAAEALLGRSRQEMIGTSVFALAFFDPDDAPRVASRLARAAKGERSGAEEFTLRRPDGRLVDVEVSSSLVTLGDQVVLFGVARDVTARRRAERALRDSEDRYRDLVENIEELICTHDLEGRILSVNRAVLEKLGVERAADVVGRSLGEFLTPPARPGFPDYLARIAREGRASGLMVVVTARGEERVLEFRNTVRHDAHGAPVVRGVSRDVTERRRAEHEIRALNEQLEHRVQERTEELRLSQERFEALARTAPVGIFRTDRWAQMTYANEAWSNLTGLTAEEGLGSGYLEVIHPDDRARFLAPWPRSADDPRAFQFEGRLRRRDGSVPWVVVRVVPEYGPGGVTGGSVGTLTDITALRVAEEEQRKLAALVDASPDVIAVSDLDGRIVYLNAAGRRLVGVDAGDVRAHTLLDVVAPAAHEHLRSTVLPAMRQHGAWEGQTRLRRFDRDETIDVEGRGFVIEHAEDDGPRFLAFVARDIDDRKRAEAALRDSEEQLRQAQKMEAVGRLAGGIAHDFNNLLTVIIGQSELLAVSLAADERRRRPVDVIRRTGERAAALTRQLLAFSRKQVLNPAVLDLNEVVTGITSLLRRVIGEDVELSTVQAPALGKIRADRSQLEQVIMNLAVNARDAMPRGGRLTIETGNAHRDAGVPREESGDADVEYTLLTVTDTGIGMSPEVQAKIFEPFFTTKEPGKGTGLGLATVYGIVRQHGGHIGVETAVGRGTTFRIYLPRVEEPEPVVGPPAPPPMPRGDETILLVEDEAEVRDVVRTMLEALGYGVLEARGPEEAIRLAATLGAGIDLLLSDVVMPGMNGWDVAHHIRARCPTLPVLFMSGYSGDADGAHDAVDADAPRLEKPFTRADLARAVRGVLDGGPGPEAAGAGGAGRRAKATRPHTAVPVRHGAARAAGPTGRG
jgi:PAS domain S-box-containing protein